MRLSRALGESCRTICLDKCVVPISSCSETSIKQFV